MVAAAIDRVAGCADDLDHDEGSGARSTEALFLTAGGGGGPRRRRRRRDCRPARFMIGMVNVPVATTLATALPDTVPIIALQKIATLAGPPRIQPNAA